MCYGPAVIDAEYLNGGEPGLSQTLAPLRQSTTYTYGRDLRLMACHVIDLLDKSGKANYCSRKCFGESKRAGMPGRIYWKTAMDNYFVKYARRGMVLSDMVPVLSSLTEFAGMRVTVPALRRRYNKLKDAGVLLPQLGE